LHSLSASANHLTFITDDPLPSGLTHLTLERNKFTDIASLINLSGLKQLRRLDLRHNAVKQIAEKTSGRLPVLPHLTYLDVSYNQISSWDFINDIPDVFPSLTGLRIAFNPLYEKADESASSNTASMGVEEGYMLTLARIGNITSLNYSNITPQERLNAEMYYLSRIAKEMAAVSESEEARIIQDHKRWAELCELYGAPVVKRDIDQQDKNTLAGRLIKFEFHLKPNNPKIDKDASATEITKIADIPRGVDVYRLKGIVGQMFGLTPMQLSLTWETDEFDPVAGTGAQISYDSEDEDEDEGSDSSDASPSDPDQNQDVSRTEGDDSKNRWVRREVELEDSTREVGFWIDGSKAKVRVELREL
jgi:tubulin-specific chaperone E